MVDMRLEVVILPVSDVDRARAFYEQAGFHLDVDHQPNEAFRVVQFTPPGSDIEEAVAELTERGIDTDPIRHMGPEGWVDGVDPERRKYGSYSGFTDPDDNGWILQEVGGGTTRTARHQDDE
jgi:catechol 2,3-dioxygenase-like lactoylglutathione lyase family enzyme